MGLTGSSSPSRARRPDGDRDVLGLHASVSRDRVLKATLAVLVGTLAFSTGCCGRSTRVRPRRDDGRVLLGRCAVRVLPRSLPAPHTARRGLAARMGRDAFRAPLISRPPPPHGRRREPHDPRPDAGARGAAGIRRTAGIDDEDSRLSNPKRRGHRDPHGVGDFVATNTALRCTGRRRSTRRKRARSRAGSPSGRADDRTIRRSPSGFSPTSRSGRCRRPSTIRRRRFR